MAKASVIFLNMSWGPPKNFWFFAKIFRSRAYTTSSCPPNHGFRVLKSCVHVLSHNFTNIGQNRKNLNFFEKFRKFPKF